MTSQKTAIANTVPLILTNELISALPSNAVAHSSRWKAQLGATYQSYGPQERFLSPLKYRK